MITEADYLEVCEEIRRKANEIAGITGAIQRATAAGSPAHSLAERATVELLMLTSSMARRKAAMQMVHEQGAVSDLNLSDLAGYPMQAPEREE